MIFEKNVIYTGTSIRKSKNTDTEYMLVNFLDDEGVQFSALAKCNIPSDINQLDSVRATFDLNLGRYMNISVCDIDVL